MFRAAAGQHRGDMASTTVYYRGAREIVRDTKTWKAVVFGGRVAVSTTACTLLFVTAQPHNAVHTVCMRLAETDEAVCADDIEQHTEESGQFTQLDLVP